jgi:hypothetical protein
MIAESYEPVAPESLILLMASQSAAASLALR